MLSCRVLGVVGGWGEKGWGRVVGGVGIWGVREKVGKLLGVWESCLLGLRGNDG